MPDRQEEIQKKKEKIKIVAALSDEVSEAVPPIVLPCPESDEDENDPEELSAQGNSQSDKSRLSRRNVGLIPLRRFGALLIDQAIIWGTTLVIACLVGIAILMTGCGFFHEHVELLARMVVLLFLLFVCFGGLAQYWLYAGVYESSEAQATPGMRLFGIISCNINGEPLSLKQVLLRQTIQHAILLFSGILSCWLYLLIGHVFGGSYLLNLLPIFPVLIMFGLSLIRKDGRNLFDLLGRKIVRKKTEPTANPRIVTLADQYSKQMRSLGIVELYWRLNLALLVFSIVVSVLFDFTAYLNLEQSCKNFENQFPKVTAGGILTNRAPALSEIRKKQPLLANYYYVKALVNELTENREAADCNFERALVLNDRCLFQFERAENLRALGRFDEAIEAASRALALMEQGKTDVDGALFSVPFGKDNQELKVSTVNEQLSLENILLLRGRIYLDLKEGSKYFSKVKRLGIADLNRVIAMVSEKLAKEPSEKLYKHRADLQELVGNLDGARKDREQADLLARRQVELKVDGVTLRAGTR